MSHKDILNRTVIVIILGNIVNAEAMSDGLAALRTNVGTISIRRLQHRIGNGGMDKKFGCFLEAVNESFHDGNRMVIVSGFPANIEEAHLIESTCPHVMVFSLEGKDEIIGQRGIKHALKHNPRTQVHVVDATRQIARQQHFISNRIGGLLRDTAITAKVESLGQPYLVTA